MRRDVYGADPTVVKLGAGNLRAVVNPRHGAEIAELIVSGRQVLSRTPWKRRPAVRAANESDWLGAWAGGWQVLFPSAGGAGVANGCWHPFHGASSQAPWTLRTVGPTTATLCWADDGWHVERRIVLTDDAVRVETEATNATTSAKAAVVVEHLTFGGDLLADKPARLRSGPGRLQALNEEGAPTGKSRQWPIAADGEDWSFVPAVGPASRFGVLVGLADTSLSLRLTDLELRMRWDASLPFLWYWLELDATSEAPWNSSARALGLEPASFPHALGLTRASQDGSARVIGPSESWSWFIEITAVGRAR